ncbi:uncharacterized protein LOC126905316 [Daktulosphaira vitifoliae]|uniref:uncharacterized protein LOC126905316 n=1 Tax=Daktulosphaira vitifoliae TaxID=58002 RepID=UPI0021AA7869|nr:uncharacterized protein LOC126905316 [Daktulosphaira vitifoliae]
MVSKSPIVIICIFAIVQMAFCALPTNFEMPSNGVLPSPVKYFENAQYGNKTNVERSHEPRFGYIPSSFSSGLSGGVDGFHGNTLSYGPQNFDIGGLIVGAVVGLGVLILIPKLIYIFFSATNIFGGIKGGYPHGYGRSDDIIPGISELVKKFEESMDKYSINTTECMQKALCTYVQSNTNLKGRSGEVDNFINSAVNTLIKSSMTNFIIDGSKFKSALENGKNGDCGQVYTQCPFNQESVTRFLRQISSKM